MAGYTKLWASILQSTVWQESLSTKVTWITMLALCDSRGYVGASIPGLAHSAGVTIPECEAALAAFLAPDPYSRTQEHEGRRLEVEEGGWRVLNYERHREGLADEERRALNRESQRRSRARRAAKAAEDTTVSPMTVTKTRDLSAGSPQAEAEAEAEAVSSSSSTTARERLPDDYRPDYDALRRASHSPETLDREVLALTSGRHPTIDHLTPEDVGVGMRELVLAGAPQSKLSRFAQVARDQRLHPRPSGGHFRAGHDDDEAARQRLLAKYPEEARAT